MIKFGLALLLFLPTAAHADWYVINKTDEFTDEKVLAAVWEDEDHRIQISREHYVDPKGKEDSQVVMFITIKTLDTFEPKTPIDLRVDENPATVLNAYELDEIMIPIKGVTGYTWEPKTVRNLIWHGDESQKCGYIKELAEGKELKVRYRIDRTSRTTFSADLRGARAALKEALELENCI